jgi:hypothetical protein
MSIHHRVERVLGFFSSRQEWDPPTPSPAGECIPSACGSRGGTHSLAGEGVGKPQFGREDRHCVTLGIYVLCGVYVPYRRTLISVKMRRICIGFARGEKTHFCFH